MTRYLPGRRVRLSVIRIHQCGMAWSSSSSVAVNKTKPHTYPRDPPLLEAHVLGIDYSVAGHQRRSSKHPKAHGVLRVTSPMWSRRTRGTGVSLGSRVLSSTITTGNRQHCRAMFAMLPDHFCNRWLASAVAPRSGFGLRIGISTASSLSARFGSFPLGHCRNARNYSASPNPPPASQDTTMPRDKADGGKKKGPAVPRPSSR